MPARRNRPSPFRAVIRNSPLPFLNGLPLFPLNPFATAGTPVATQPVMAQKPAPTGPEVLVSARRHPCAARTTPAKIAQWMANATKLSPALLNASRLYPGLKIWNGVPLLLFYGIESDWTLGAVSAIEEKAKSLSTRPSRSWGIGQVLDLNFPRIYKGRAAADNVMIPPPTMDQASIQGADLIKPGTGLSGLHYSTRWMDNAARAYAATKTDTDGWKLLNYAGTGVSEEVHKAIFLRLWGGGSSQASVERRVPDNYFGIKECAEAVARAIKPGATIF